MKGKKRVNIIVSMIPEAFNSLIKKGKVNIIWERYNIREFIKPTQCYNCFRYGHTAKHCRQSAEIVVQKSMSLNLVVVTHIVLIA